MNFVSFLKFVPIFTVRQFWMEFYDRLVVYLRKFLNGFSCLHIKYY